MRIPSILVLCLLPAAAFTRDSALDLDGGWQEAVVSVPDAGRAAAFYQAVGGWIVHYDGAVEASQLSAWRLPRNASAKEIVLGNPDDATGYVRLLQFAGVDQELIRPSARAWEPGGHGGFNVRVLDIEARFRDFQKWGWHGYSRPVRFSLDRFTVREVMMQGFGGELIAMIERVHPPLKGWPTLKSLSRPFNAFATVRDIEATEAFYKEVLGFSEYLREEGPSAAPGPNLFRLPHNWVANVPRKLVWLHPRGENEGSIAVQQFLDLEGTDFSARTAPPNLGMLMFRFPVTDAGARASEFEARLGDLEYGPLETTMQPYGAVKVFALRDPNGGWLEFFEPLE